MKIIKPLPYREMEEIEADQGLQFLLKPFLFIIFIWIVFWLDFKFDLDLYVLGILPLEFEGLPGIIFSPFIHGNLSHLLNNTIPLLVLGAALFYFYPKVSNYIIVFSWLFSGIIVWFIGRDSYHIGASGLIYALAGFIFLSGILRRQTNLLALSLLVVFLYGGLVWGVLPLEDKVSWEAHLSGAVSGFLLAIHFRKVSPVHKSKKKELHDFPIEEDYFDDDEEDIIGDAWKEYSGEHSIHYIYKPKDPTKNNDKE